MTVAMFRSLMHSSASANAADKVVFAAFLGMNTIASRTTCRPSPSTQPYIPATTNFCHGASRIVSVLYSPSG